MYYLRTLSKNFLPRSWLAIPTPTATKDTATETHSMADACIQTDEQIAATISEQLQILRLAEPQQSSGLPPPQTLLMPAAPSALVTEELVLNAHILTSNSEAALIAFKKLLEEELPHAEAVSLIAKLATYEQQKQTRCIQILNPVFQHFSKLAIPPDKRCQKIDFLWQLLELAPPTWTEDKLHTLINGLQDEEKLSKFLERLDAPTKWQLAELVIALEIETDNSGIFKLTELREALNNFGENNRQKLLEFMLSLYKNLQDAHKLKTFQKVNFFLVSKILNAYSSFRSHDIVSLICKIYQALKIPPSDWTDRDFIKIFEILINKPPEYQDILLETTSVFKEETLAESCCQVINQHTPLNADIFKEFSLVILITNLEQWPLDVLKKFLSMPNIERIQLINYLPTLWKKMNLERYPLEHSSATFIAFLGELLPFTNDQLPILESFISLSLLPKRFLTNVLTFLDSLPTGRPSLAPEHNFLPSSTIIRLISNFIKIINYHLIDNNILADFYITREFNVHFQEDDRFTREAFNGYQNQVRNLFPTPGLRHLPATPQKILEHFGVLNELPYELIDKLDVLITQLMTFCKKGFNLVPITKGQFNLIKFLANERDLETKEIEDTVKQISKLTAFLLEDELKMHADAERILAQTILAIPQEKRAAVTYLARDMFLDMYEKEKIVKENWISDIPPNDKTPKSIKAREEYAFTFYFTPYKETYTHLLGILQSLPDLTPTWLTYNPDAS